ncbi:hypothetical protein ACJZ2D_006598 [Fusarium nematophilum]
MKTPKSSKKKKSKPKKDSSPDFDYRPFSDFQSSPPSACNQSTASSNSWMKECLDPVTSIPYRSQPTNDSAASTGAAYDSDDPFATPPKTQTAQAQQTKTTAGTGHHDDKLTQARGNFREPSLRRDFGKVVETPLEMRRDISRRREQGQWGTGPAPGTETAQPSSSFGVDSFSSGQGCSTLINAGNNPFGLPQPLERRGDVPPLKTHRLVAVPKKSVVKKSPGKKKSAKNTPAKKTPVKKGAANNPPKLQHPNAVRIEALNICLTIKDKYLNLSSTPEDTEEMFWSEVVQRLDSRSQTKNLFNSWKHLRQFVEDGCERRRQGLREGKLPPPRPTKIELDNVIDRWNHVWLQRFHELHQNPCENVNNARAPIWPVEMEEKIWAFVEQKLRDWTNDMLEKRIEELEKLTRPPLLRGDKAVISWVMDLQPGLETFIREHLDKAMDSTQEDAHTDEDDEVKDDVSMGDGNGETMEGSSSGKGSGTVLPSIEPTAPMVDPRIMAQLYNYEWKYQQALHAAQDEEGKRRQDLFAPDINTPSTRKRKTPADNDGSPTTSSLPIRAKKSRPSVAAEAVTTPTKVLWQRQNIGDPESAASPAFSSVSSEFPPIDQLFSSNIGRSSPVTSRPSQSTTSPVMPDAEKLESKNGTQDGRARKSKSRSRSVRHGRASKSKSRSRPPVGVDSPVDAEPPDVRSQPSTGQTRNDSPNLFVTPDPSLVNREEKIFKVKRSVSRNVDQSSAHRSDGESPPRFREHTADFRAMTPDSRQMMLYYRLREMK